MLFLLIAFEEKALLAGRRLPGPAPSTRRPCRALLQPAPLALIPQYPIHTSDHALLRIVSQQELAPTLLPLVELGCQPLVPDV
jgi:hypothetical protein